MEVRIHTWKDELYFEVGIRMGSEKAISSCDAGAIAYWPQGDAICLFFDKMTPYGKVNPIGQLSNIDFKAIFAIFTHIFNIFFKISLEALLKFRPTLFTANTIYIHFKVF